MAKDTQGIHASQFRSQRPTCCADKKVSGGGYEILRLVSPNESGVHNVLRREKHGIGDRDKPWISERSADSEE